MEAQFGSKLRDFHAAMKMTVIMPLLASQATREERQD